MNAFKKNVKMILFVSLLLNFVFAVYAGYKIYTKLNVENNVIPMAQRMDSITFVFARDNVFRHLPNDSNEIIMLGNSLTNNFEWHEMFSDQNLKNRGINGDITLGVLKRIKEITESKPSKVFIEIGVNDLLEGFAIEETFENYKKIIKTIRKESSATKIFVQSLLPCSWYKYGTNERVSPDILKLNSKLKDYCTQADIQYIDLYPHFAVGNDLNQKFDCGDGLHLNGTGYVQWCKLIKIHLQE